jgi:hypothetical protein
MIKAKKLHDVLRQTQGSPDVEDLRKLVAHLQRRLKFRKGLFWLISALIYGAFFVIGATAHDLDTEHVIALIVFSVIIFPIFFLMCLGPFLYIVMTYSCEEELTKTTHALKSLTDLSVQIDNLVDQTNDFILFLRGFEREQAANSAKSLPTYPDRELVERAHAWSLGHVADYDTAMEDYERRVDEFDDFWIQQLGLLTAVRKYGSVVLLDNFNLETAKHEELRRAGIGLAPATSATWWSTFLVLASKARITIILSEQRSVSVFAELTHLSEHGLPYLIVTTEELVKVLQRYSPGFVENALYVVRLSNWSQLDEQAAIITPMLPFLQSQALVKPAGQRAPRLEAQAAPNKLPPDSIDWSNRSEAVAQLAMHYDAIRWQMRRKLPLVPKSFFGRALLNCILGVILCIAAAFIQSRWLRFAGPGYLVFGLTYILVPKTIDYVSKRKQNRKREQLRHLLQGRDYLDLMNEWGISIQELQWVINAQHSRKQD